MAIAETLRPTPPDGPEAAAEPAAGRFWRRFVRWDLASVTVALVVICGALIVSVPAFRSTYNLRALGFSIAVTGIVALSQASVLAVGQFNLALTSIGAIAGLSAAWLMQALGWPWEVATVGGIAVGGLLGAVQGAIIVSTGINAFIVSLSLGAAYFGTLLGTTRGSSFNQLPPQFVGFGHAFIAGVPVLLIVAIVVALLVGLLFGRTVTGRQLLAVGASPRAALMSGIPASRIVVTAHILSGVLAAIAAVMLVTRLGSAQPSLGGDWLLPSFAAPVLGGTLLTGGKMSVAGALLGALLLAVIANGLVLFGVSAYWYQSVLGLVLLAALATERARQSYVVRHQL